MAYLHNYLIQENDPLIDPHYAEHIEKAPVFRKGEMEKLRSYIKKYIKYGDKNNIIFKIDNGELNLLSHYKIAWQICYKAILSL